MKKSAGILLYKRTNEKLFVLLAHPGGPFWKNKDAGAWSVPKGEYTADENAFDAAIREFAEETGIALNGNYIHLEPVKLSSGKIIDVWASEQSVDATTIKSNFFSMEWPPKSGVQKEFPEVDKAEWFSVEQALLKINTAQKKFIEQLIAIIK